MHFRMPKSQWSPSHRESESFPCATRRGRLKRSSCVMILCLFVGLLRADAEQQNPRYVQNGKTLQLADETLARAKYKRWQIWLYQDGVRIPDYAAGLQYSRWGLIEGESAESVTKNTSIRSGTPCSRFVSCTANWHARATKSTSSAGKSNGQTKWSRTLRTICQR